jgi:hypothetical protein
VEISMILGDDCVIRCYITPNTARYIITTRFVDPLGSLVTGEEDEEEDPNLEIFEM